MKKWDEPRMGIESRWGGEKARRKQKTAADGEHTPSDELFHMGRRANRLVEDKDNGMPSLDQILPYVLRLAASDRQGCLCGILDHTVGPARSTSVKPISDVAFACSK